MDVNECSYEQSYDGRKGALPERIEVHSRPERRRRWSSAAKLAIIRETLASGSTAQAVADRHGIGTGLIYTWRKQMLRAAMTGFAAAEIKPDVPVALPGPVPNNRDTATAIGVAVCGRIIERVAGRDRGRVAVRGSATLRVGRGRRGVAAHPGGAGHAPSTRMMLPPATRVYLACGLTDMRKGFDGPGGPGADGAVA